MVPLCRTLLDAALLTARERDWIDGYHREVWESTKGFFEEGGRSWTWLRRETGAL